MKKKIITLILCIISSVCFSQEIKEISTTFPVYQGIVTSDIPATELYKKAKLWMSENFSSVNDAIQLDSPETGTLVSKGIYKGRVYDVRAHITLKIEIKDNRFRYTITISDMRSGTMDVSSYSVYADNPNGKYATRFSDTFRNDIKGWMVGIVTSSINNSTDDDW